MENGRLKLEYIANNSARNQSFKKRKKGFLKKANELATLCGVKVCAVINSCDNTGPPEFWPSEEDVRAVHSKFLDVEETQRFKKMYNQDSHLWERIQKEEEKARRLHAENREMELKEVMFDLLKGKTMSPHHYSDPGFLGELNLFIGDHVNKLTYRTEFLEANGAPNVPVTDAYRPVVGNVNPFDVGTEGSVSNPTEFYDHMRQYDGVDMSVNEQAHGGSNDHVHHQNMNHQQPFQYQTPPDFDDQTQPRFNGSSQGMNMNLQEPFQSESPGEFYDQTQPWFNGSSQDMYTGLNQYPDSNQSLMSPFMGQPQQMSDVQALASVASLDDNSYDYNQLPITSQMPLTTTTTTATLTADLSDHSIDNKRWPTRFGLD